MGYNLPLDVELATQRSISAISSGHTADAASVIRHLNGGIVSELRMSRISVFCIAAAPVSDGPSSVRSCQIYWNALNVFIRSSGWELISTSISGCSEILGVHEAGWSSIQRWTGSQMGGPKLPKCKYVFSWGLLLEEWLGGYLCKKWSDIPNTPNLKTPENELPWKRAMW